MWEGEIDVKKKKNRKIKLMLESTPRDEIYNALELFATCTIYIFITNLSPPAQFGRLSSLSCMFDGSAAAELLFIVTADFVTRTRIGYTVIVAVTAVMAIGCPTKLANRVISPTLARHKHLFPLYSVIFLILSPLH